MESMSGIYDPVLVTLSFIISVIGSFAALRLARVIPAQEPEHRLPWILAASFALGAGGIWSMHFIGMLAFDMGMTVGYDLPLTSLSLVLAWVVSAAGFWIAGRGVPTLPKIAGAGAVMGCGVAIMHYTGMAAMEMPAALRLDTGLVALSVAIAVLASCAALWLALNLKLAWQMAAASVVMGIAVTGMHYTGMAAASFEKTPGAVATVTAAFSAEFVAYTVFLLSLIVMVLGIAFGRAPAGDRRLALD